MKKTLGTFGLLISIALMIAGCKHQPDITEPIVIDDGGGNPNPCDPNIVYFQNTILPLIVNSCALPDCHDAITHEEGITLDSYEHIMDADIIDIEDPWNSEMIEKITDNDPDDIMPPPPNDPISDADLNLIITWIEQGAQNNSCIADCDPNSVVTYAGIIYPIIDNNCNGCHSATNPSGTLSLITYADISGIALDGRLMSSLLGTDPYNIMPDGTTGLSQCQIDQFQAWVDAGAQEN